MNNDSNSLFNSPIPRSQKFENYSYSLQQTNYQIEGSPNEHEEDGNILDN